MRLCRLSGVAMIPIATKLRSWAQNEEMIDQHFLEHGEDCNEAADLLEFYEAQNAVLLKEQSELQELVMDLVTQACWTSDGSFDSCAISTFAEAMRYLASKGKLKIMYESHRRVIAHYPDEEK